MHYNNELSEEAFKFLREKNWITDFSFSENNTIVFAEDNLESTNLFK